MTTELRDQIAYANQWGNPKTWHGRLMYSSPEQAAEWEAVNWRDFCAAIGCTIGEVDASPSDFADEDGLELLDLLEWAMLQWHARHAVENHDANNDE